MSDADERRADLKFDLDQCRDRSDGKSSSPKALLNDVPPPTPLPPPVLNPSSPNTVSQPSYQPITPTTPSTTPSTPTTVPSDKVRSPAKEEPSSTTTRSERTSVPKTVHHHHRGRSIGVGPTLGYFYCPYGWCVRISPPSAYYRQMAGIAIEARTTTIVSAAFLFYSRPAALFCEE
jgi:hypothetical protein